VDSGKAELQKVNIGVLILAILMAAGAVLVIVEAGASQSTPYVDTYGNTMSAATNNTQGVIINGTAPAAGLGGGAVIFLAVLVLFVSSLVVYRAATSHGSGGRYSSRHG
jgi:uncharacterized membrane protein